MLCPEVWDFDSPGHRIELHAGNDNGDADNKEQRLLDETISSHYFNHSVSLTLPNTLKIPESFNQIILEDSDYYRVDGLPAVELINKEFIEAFVKKGELNLLTIGRRVDVDNLAAVLPSGLLILNLVRASYQSLRIEGKPTFFERKEPSRYDDEDEEPSAMPKKHQVASLCELALRSVSEYVTSFGKRIVQPITMLSSIDPKKGQAYLNSLLMTMRQQLGYTVPWNLHDRMAVETLRGIDELINEIKNAYTERSTVSFIAEINVAINLTRVIVHPNLKCIEFSAWPKLMRHALYDCLADMTGLEVLDLGSGSVGWKTSDIEKIIVGALGNMKHLTSFTLCFDCTDNIIAALCQNCPRLQKLDVTASRSVTDRSIFYLLKCQQLREIKLLRTSVSVPGYASLLLNHACLEDIGRYDEFGVALEYIQHSGADRRTDKPFRLKSFECRNMSLEQLYLLVDMCPHLSSLSVLRDERIDDLSILASLTELRELKLLSCDYYANNVHVLLDVIGCNLVSLHLEHVGEIDLDALVGVSQYCPNLRGLVFYNCEFLPVVRNLHHRQQRNYNNNKLLVSPFGKLERLKCVVDCAETHLEFVLQHCSNVKSIHLGSSTGIGDATMRRVLARNPMRKLEELKILYSNDLSMSTVHLLMENCENLSRLSELESWDGVAPHDLDAFRQELRRTNIDLDTSPTLSLAS